MAQATPQDLVNDLKRALRDSESLASGCWINAATGLPCPLGQVALDRGILTRADLGQKSSYIMQQIATFYGLGVGSLGRFLVAWDTAWEEYKWALMRADPFLSDGSPAREPDGLAIVDAVFGDPVEEAKLAEG